MVALIIYVLIGFLLANGLPHLTAGAGSIPFRSPMCRNSKPKINVGWGLVNLIAALILFTWRISVDTAAHGQMVALLAGIVLGYAMFGFAANFFYAGPPAEELKN